MARRLLAATLLVLSLFSPTTIGGCRCNRSPGGADAAAVAPVAPAERWVNTRSHDLLIVEDKETIEPTTDQTTQHFFEQFPRLASDWRSRIRGAIEPLPGARPRPKPDEPHFQARRSAPVAIVTGYSERNVVIKVLEPLGRLQGYRVHACLASLQAPRSGKLDLTLDLDRLAKTYGRVVHGIRQGSTPEQVRAALGEPTQKHRTKRSGYFRWYYTGERLQVVFDDGVVLQLNDTP